MSQGGLRRKRRPLYFIAILALVVLFSLTDLVLDVANRLFKYLLRIFGLGRIEPWLKAQPWWFCVAIIVPAILLEIVSKVYIGALLVHAHILKAVTLEIVFKIISAGFINFLFHVYEDRLLAIGWIARPYNWYIAKKAYVLDLLHSTLAYRFASRLWQRVKRAVAAKRGSAFATAKRINERKS